MNYEWVRHYQRYEYVVIQGRVIDAVVADVGCGQFPLGSYALAYSAKRVFAIDPKAVSLKGVPHFGVFKNYRDRVVIVKKDFFNFGVKVDVAIAIEAFEHMPEPRKFIVHLAGICDHAFITTPLAKITGRTRNPLHVAEYSAKDFNEIVGEHFDVIQKSYQSGNLAITRTASPNGDSYNVGHVVQMLWCRSKHNG